MILWGLCSFSGFISSVSCLCVCVRWCFVGHSLKQSEALKKEVTSLRQKLLLSDNLLVRVCNLDV
jgi:hypothetical protein